MLRLALQPLLEDVQSSNIINMIRVWGRRYL